MPHKDPERLAEQKRKDARAAYHRLRARIMERMGGKCVRCDIDDTRVLVVDHKFGGGEQERRRTSMTRFYYEILADPYPFQLLCHNCNHLKRLENLEDIRKPKSI